MSRTVKTVRVKDGKSFRNGMWHGLRNDKIMRNDLAWRTLLVYTAKNLTSFGSYELIKTQIASIFGKKLKFINSFSLNIFFSGCNALVSGKPRTPIPGE